MSLDIDVKLLRRAAHYTGVRKRADLVRLALETLIALEAGKRLAARGGTQKNLRRPRRRRSGSAA